MDYQFNIQTVLKCFLAANEIQRKVKMPKSLPIPTILNDEWTCSAPCVNKQYSICARRLSVFNKNIDTELVVNRVFESVQSTKNCKIGLVFVCICSFNSKFVKIRSR